MKFNRFYLLLFLLITFSISAFSQTENGWKWRFNPFKTVQRNYYTLADDNNVYIKGEDNKIYAVNKVTGKLIWQLKGKKGIYGLRSNKNNLILVGYSIAESSQSNQDFNSLISETEISSISPVDGKINWTVKDEKYQYPYYEMTDKYFFHSVDGGIKAFDLENGKLKWINKDGKRFPVLLSDGLLFVSANESFCIIDSETGQTVWKIFEKNSGFRFVAEQNDILVVAKNNYGLAVENTVLIGYDIKTQKQLWQTVPINTSLSLNYTQNGNSLIVSPLDSADLYSFDLVTGKTLWHIPSSSANSQNSLFAPTFSENQIYCSNLQGNLKALDKATGKTIWNRKISNSEVTTPIIVSNSGYVSSDNIIYKINLLTGTVIWKFIAYAYVSNLQIEQGILYFETLDSSYNAVDLAKVDELHKKGLPLGTLNPIRKLLKKPTFTISGPK